MALPRLGSKGGSFAHRPSGPPLPFPPPARSSLGIRPAHGSAAGAPGTDRRVVPPRGAPRRLGAFLLGRRQEAPRGRRAGASSPQVGGRQWPGGRKPGGGGPGHRTQGPAKGGKGKRGGRKGRPGRPLGRAEGGPGELGSRGAGSLRPLLVPGTGVRP